MEILFIFKTYRPTLHIDISIYDIGRKTYGVSRIDNFESEYFVNEKNC